MPSIIPGFEYDIFISYRQKDNEYDRWVTEFVQNLNRELKGTFKEDISIYFDENPYDGLLETHHVEESLSPKIKALVLIPILSQTYCDEKSYAWNNEFLPFNKLSQKDSFGRDIKLSNGNVASRILPVKIHELDGTDLRLLENTLGDEIRCIEFIYKAAGVNRSLRPKDDDLAKGDYPILYRDQINKLANALKQIIYRLREMDPESIHHDEEERPALNPGFTPVQIAFRTKILKQISIFSRLNNIMLEDVASNLKSLSVPSGEEIIKKGEKGNAVYIIVDGRVKVHDGQHVFSYLSGGDYFGELTLIDEKERSASVTTVEDSSLFKLEKDGFQNLLTNNPYFTSSILLSLVDRIRKLDRDLERLSSKQAQQE